MDVIREFEAMQKGIYLKCLVSALHLILMNTKSIKPITIQSPDSLSLYQAMLPIRDWSKFDLVISQDSVFY